MKKIYRFYTILLILIFSLSGTDTYAQFISILTTNDTAVCGPVTLRATRLVQTHTVSNPVDDDYAPHPSDIGFRFVFYGTTYNKCLISSNGYVTFNIADSGQGSAWSLTSAPGIPSNTAIVNSIAGVYEDIYLVTGGTITTSTIGAAPNRVFVVTFCACPLFTPSTCPGTVTFQIMLYETTNYIEVHITNKTSCSAWNGGLAIEGVENAAGTVGTPTPGRNNTVWTATNDGQRFIDTGTTVHNYIDTSIPFVFLNTDSVSPIHWYQGSTYLGTGDNITVTPTTATVYTAKAVRFGFGCGANNDTVSADITVLMGTSMDIRDVVTQPSTCGACNGKIVLHGLKPFALDTIFYKKNGVWQTPYLFTPSSDSSASLLNLCAGFYDSIFAKASICPSNVLPLAILTDPTLKAQYAYTVNYGCKGDTVFFTNQSTVQGATVINYAWKFGDGTFDTATSPMHIYKNQGTYSPQLYVTNTTCFDSISKSINLAHPIKAVFIVDKDTICEGQAVTVTNNSIGNLTPTPPTYYWEFADGTTDNTKNPTHNFSLPGTYVIKMTETDFVPCRDSAFHTIIVDSISSNYFTTSDSVLCLGKEIIFTGYSILDGRTSTVWSFGDSTHIYNRNPIGYAFSTVGTYHVIFTANFRVCPDTSFSKDLTILPYPIVNIGRDTSLCPGSGNITITDIANINNPSVSWLWNTGETGPSITVSNPGWYYATVKMNGCSAADSMFIKNDCYLDIPNVFTPNGDGVNDYFLPRQFLSAGLTTFHMEIFNRWGQLIFETSNVNGRGWDGKYGEVAQPEGVYIYMIDATFKDNGSEHRKGNVTLLR